MSEPILTVENLGKTYRDGKTAVQNLSFQLCQGNVLALLGPNGAGKTTTIKMILNLVTPDKGHVQVFGHNMAMEREMQLGLTHIGAVLEGARNSYWRLSVIDNLLYFGGLSNTPRSQLKKRCEEMVAFLDLQDVAYKEVGLLSRGMQQKVAVGLALLHDPEILLLDEPTLGLDIQAAKVLEAKILELSRQGKAIILTTHAMSLAERLSSHILVMNKGKCIAHGNKQELLKRFNVRTTTEIHLTSPLDKRVRAAIYDTFPAVKITTENDHTICIAWQEPEQHQVIQLLGFLDDHQQTIMNVIRRESNLEEIFLSLIGESNHVTAH